MENDHILVAMFHNYWEYPHFFLKPRVQKEREPSVTSPLSFTGIKNVITVKELFVMKVGPTVKGLFPQL
jgi:hypothetical protein